MSNPDIIEAAGRGRKRGSNDQKPRRSTAFSPRMIIKAAAAAGFDDVRIDSDGQITLQKSRPDTAGDDKGENEQWDKRIAEVIAKEKARQGGE
jgi:hypothetical protein